MIYTTPQQVMDDVKKSPRFQKRGGKREAYYDHVLNNGFIKGLWLEFGVWKGDTIAKIANKAPLVYGFDSFQGLPEYWTKGYPAGHYAHPDAGNVAVAVKKVEALKSNIKVIPGMFHDSLPGFLRDHPGNIALIHIDSDLYSSANTVLRGIGDRIVPGTVMMFDELFGYPGFELHEMKAFIEFSQRHDHEYEWIGHVFNGGQATCVIR